MGSIVRNLRVHGGLPAGTAVIIDDALAAGALVVIMDDADDVTGGGTTQTVGFQILDHTKAPIDYEVVLEYVAFAEIERATQLASATLATATAGNFVAGEGTNATIVKTDATGKFTCTLTDNLDEDVFFGCRESFASPNLTCTDVDSVTFSA